jgi:hypothetical protein
MGIAGGYPVRSTDEGHGGCDEEQNDRELNCNDNIIEARGFVHADDKQGRNSGNDGHRWHVEERARRMPGGVRRVVYERRAGIGGGHNDPKILEKAHYVTRPTDCDRRCAERVFQNEIPADDPGDQFAHRRIGVGVGAARDWNRRGHFGVAQPGKSAGKSAEHKG